MARHFPLTAPPEDLLTRDQWVRWRYKKMQGKDKPTKPPFHVTLDLGASHSDPRTWGSYADALAHVGEHRTVGLGYVFAKDDPNTGIDLDDCLAPGTGTLDPWAQKLVDLLDSYTEVSPSGTGVKIWIRGKLKVSGRRKAQVEVYSWNRYFTFTGQHFPGTPTTIKERQTELDRFMAKHFPEKTSGAQPIRDPANPFNRPHQPVDVADYELLELAKGARNGTAFSALWSGDASAHSNDHSVADLALCAHLAFWTGNDAARIDHLFRASGLHRNKWDETHYSDGRTYGQATIEKAIDMTNSTYEPPSNRKNKTGEAPQRPAIYVSTKIEKTVDQAEAALLKVSNAPIYCRGRRLVRVVADAKPPKFLHRLDGAPSIDEVPEAYLTELLSRAAEWWMPHHQKDPPWRRSRPPTWVAKTLAARGHWKFPPLTGIILAPTLRPDGSVLDRPGYDPGTGLLFYPGSVKWPSVPASPTRQQAHDALAELIEAFVEFPFADRTDQAAALAAVLTVLARHAILGPVPLYAIRARAAGTGKSLLADVVAILGTGRPAPRMAPAKDGDEERKRLVAIAGAGDSIVLIDNIAADHALGSEALDAALTASEVSDRVLGKNTGQATITLPWIAVILATGNNLTFAGDTGRRAIPVDLDAKEENPEERTGFRHDPLKPWVTNERPRLVCAALTALRAYFVAGCPRQVHLSSFGSFEEWNDLVRSTLVWTGHGDPCAGRERIREEGDPAREALGTALAAWHDQWEDQPKTLAQVKRELEADDDSAELKDALGGLCLKYNGKDLNTRSLGRALSSHQGRIVGGLRFQRRSDTRPARWAVSKP